MPLRATDLPPALRKRLGVSGAQAPPRRSKFNAIAVVVDGERFDSTKEARYWQELKIRERLGEIENLQRQPQYLITRNGVVLAVMTLDFRYALRPSRRWVVVDVKGGRATRTEAYRLRKKLVEDQYGIEIQEV